MTRADKRARRIAEHAAWLQQNRPAREEWERLGIVAARPPDAPGKQPVTCPRCRWKGQRYAEYYIHPDRAPDGTRRKRGDLSLRKAFEVDPTAKPCPRCGGSVHLA